jgi:hypothetical protein
MDARDVEHLVAEVVVRTDLVFGDELDVAADTDDPGEVPDIEVDGPDVQRTMAVEPIDLPERVEEAFARRGLSLVQAIRAPGLLVLVPVVLEEVTRFEFVAHCSAT